MHIYYTISFSSELTLILFSLFIPSLTFIPTLSLQQPFIVTLNLANVTIFRLEGLN